MSGRRRLRHPSERSSAAPRRSEAPLRFAQTGRNAVEEPAFAGLPLRRWRTHRRTSFGGEWLCRQRQGPPAHRDHSERRDTGERRASCRRIAWAGRGPDHRACDRHGSWCGLTPCGETREGSWPRQGPRRRAVSGRRLGRAIGAI